MSTSIDDYHMCRMMKMQKKRWDCTFCFYFAKGIEEILQRQSSKSYLLYCDMLAHRSVDPLIELFEIHKFEELCREAGIDDRGIHPPNKALSNSDFLDNYVYDNYKRIVSDNDYWRRRILPKQIKLSEKLWKIMKRIDTQTLAARQSLLIRIDNELAIPSCKVQRSRVSIAGPKKAEDELKGYMNVLLYLKPHDTSPVNYIEERDPSIETTLHDIYYPSFSSEDNCFDESMDSKGINVSFGETSVVKKKQQEYFDLADARLFKKLKVFLNKARRDSGDIIKDEKIQEVEITNNDYWKPIIPKLFHIGSRPSRFNNHQSVLEKSLLKKLNTSRTSGGEGNSHMSSHRRIPKLNFKLSMIASNLLGNNVMLNGSRILKKIKPNPNPKQRYVKMNTARDNSNSRGNLHSKAGSPITLRVRKGAIGPINLPPNFINFIRQEPYSMIPSSKTERLTLDRNFDLSKKQKKSFQLQKSKFLSKEKLKIKNRFEFRKLSGIPRTKSFKSGVIAKPTLKRQQTYGSFLISGVGVNK